MCAVLGLFACFVNIEKCEFGQVEKARPAKGGGRKNCHLKGEAKIRALPERASLFPSTSFESIKSSLEAGSKLALQAEGGTTKHV